MKKTDYSDWLIVSDIDGTLNNKKRKTPKVNTEAVDRFVHTLKGNFTLASARGVESLTPHYRNLPDVSTPAIVLNGAGIFDFKCNRMLYFNTVPESGMTVVKKTMEKFPFLEIGVFAENMIYLVRPRVLSPFMMKLDKLTHGKVASLDELASEKWGKVIFFCLPWQKKKIREYVQKISDGTLSYIDTTSCSFDMVNSTANKGTAVMKLAELLGVPSENTGAIGDYYNDLDMLRAVSHPACCAQAPEELHRICEFHACHCNKGAVADFISYIENKYGSTP